MRIYSDTIGYTQQLRNALQRGKDRGIIAQSVFFDRLRPFHPRQNQFGFDVILQARDYDGRGRRANTGYAGPSDSYAATFDEWGFFIAALYELDYYALIGDYHDQDDFNRRTGLSYDPREFASFGSDPMPYVEGSVSNGRSGRVGAGRWGTGFGFGYRYQERDLKEAREWYDAGNLTKKRGAYLRYAPRTAAEVAAFNGVPVPAV